jgi:hypothetical protein
MSKFEEGPISKKVFSETLADKIYKRIVKYELDLQGKHFKKLSYGLTIVVMNIVLLETYHFKNNKRTVFELYQQKNVNYKN